MSDDIVTRLNFSIDENCQGAWSNTTIVMQEAIDEIESLRAQLEWQPIETAPKDGTPLLIAFRNKEVAIAPWSKSGPMEVTPQLDLGWTATHWMPLPEPPENKP